MKRLSNARRQWLDNALTYGIVAIGYGILQLLRSGGVLSSALQGMLVPICAYAVMAVSLNLVVGISGELSLGHAGFMSVGAFTGIITAACLQNTVGSAGLRLLIAMVVGAVFAGLVGVLVGVPVLRLRGDYLAIVTLAFGEIIKNIINCLYVGIDASGLHISLKNEAALGLAEGGRTLIKGPMGATGITKLSGFTAGILLLLVTLVIALNLIHSRSGRAIMALRDNRIAGESVGLNVTKYKLMAFVISAVLAGAAGALYALNYSSVAAKKFDFNTSILVLVFVVLGGMGNVRGSVIAAVVLTVLPELLRSVQDYRMLAYAVILILVMLVTNSAGARQTLEVLRSRARRILWKHRTHQEREAEK